MGIWLYDRETLGSVRLMLMLIVSVAIEANPSSGDKILGTSSGPMCSAEQMVETHGVHMDA